MSLLTMATKSRASRLARRRAALADLEKGRDQGYAKTLTALGVLSGKSTTQEIRLRAEFISVTQPSSVVPPAALLVNSRGHALRVALLALFIAQTQGGSAPHVVHLPLSAVDVNTIAWEDLLLTQAAPGAGSTSRLVHEKRAGSARAALKRLTMPDVSLLELPLSGKPKGGYDQVRLFMDTGPRAVGAPVSYTVPDGSQDVVTIPMDFFLKGWVYVLEDSEIITYLMYRYLCAKNSPAHITAEARNDRFGIKPSSWEQYWVLASSGLLDVEVDEGRRSNGTYVGMGSGATPQPHRFTLADAGLGVDALPTVLAALDRRIAAG
ncbi:hypothetical protein [Pedococcus aerophilus]